MPRPSCSARIRSRVLRDRSARHRVAVAAVIGMFAVTGAMGCGSDEGAGSGDIGAVVRWDSAGLRIVEASRSVLEGLPVRRIDPHPVVRVGEREGRDEEMFGMVTDATMLAADRLAVADAQQRRILVFGLDGEFRYAIGRPGEGPGEFRALQRMSVIDDTLYVPDVTARRAQRFTLDGQRVDDRRMAGSIGLQSGIEYHRPGRFSQPHVYWITPDGFPRDVPEGDGPHRVNQIVARYDTLGGTKLDTLDAAPAYYVHLTLDERGIAEELGLTHYPVGNVLPHPAAPDVRVTFLVDEPVIGWSGRPELTLYTPEYEPTARFRFDSPPVDIPLDDERFRQWSVAWWQRDQYPIRTRAWNVLTPPETPARFHALRAGRDGHIWVAIGPEPPPEQGAAGGPDPAYWTRWLRIARDGTPLEWVITPQGNLLEVGPDAVLVLETDDLGVQRVAVFRYAA